MQPLAVDRLGEIAGRAERHAAPVLVEDRDHDHRDFGELGILPQRRQTDQPSRSGIMTSSVMAIGRNSLASLNPSSSARRGHDRKALRLEVIRNELARGGIVVDDEHAIGLRRRPACRW